MLQEAIAPDLPLSVFVSSDAAGDNSQTFVPTLLSVAKRTRILFGYRLAAAGFHNGQDQLLVALRPDAHFAVCTLAEILDVRPSTVSKMIDRLIEKELVERHPDERDARRTLVHITPAGLAAKEQVMRIWDAVAVEFFAALGGRGDDLTKELRNLDHHLSAKLLRIR